MKGLWKVLKPQDRTPSPRADVDDDIPRRWFDNEETDYDDEEETEVSPPTGRVDNVFKEETDYEDDNFLYDTE